MKHEQFCRKHRITATAVQVEENPNMADMPGGSYYWKVTLRHPAPDARKMNVNFSMGPALTHTPQAHEVLACLCSDSASVDNARDFEDWAGDFGWDTDSRKALRCYNACVRQAEQLRAFLGHLYNAALSFPRAAPGGPSWRRWNACETPTAVQGSSQYRTPTRRTTAKSG